MMTAVIDREQALCLFMKLDAPMVAFDAPRKWVQIARAGKYKGHPAGGFKFDSEAFATIVANFDAQKNPVPVKYGHPSGEDTGAPVPAVGWIHQLEARGNGTELWAYVEFTSDAAALIREGKYRYCSVVVDVEAIHRETAEEIGPELLELGLVNNPFIDGMEPIRLSRSAQKGTRKMSIKDVIKEALKALPDDASVEQLMAFIQAKAALEQAVAGPGGAPEDEKKAAAATEGETVVKAAADDPRSSSPESSEADSGQGMAGGADVMSAIADALGIDKAAAESLLQERLGELIAWLKGEATAEASAAPAGEATAEQVGVVANSRIKALSKQLTDKDAELRKLSARVEALEFEKVEARIDRAIEAGQLLDVEREKIVKLARVAPHLLDEFLAKPPAVPTGDKYQPRKATASNITESGEEDEGYRAMRVALSAANLLPKDKEESHKLIVASLSRRNSKRREERV